MQWSESFLSWQRTNSCWHERRQNGKFHSSSIASYRFTISNVIFRSRAGTGECEAIGISGGATKHQKLIKIQSITGFVCRFVFLSPHVSAFNWIMSFVWCEFSIFHTHRFSIELIESNQDRLKAAVILMEKLDYNEQMIYHLVLAATVSFYLCIL